MQALLNDKCLGFIYLSCW